MSRLSKFLIFILLVGCIAGFGYYQYNRPVKNAGSMSTDATLTSTQLLNAYEANEADANTKYLNKAVLVSGKVKSVEGPNITLDAGSEQAAIVCELDAGSSAPSVKQGDFVNIKGICTGFLMDVQLNRCVISKK